MKKILLHFLALFTGTTAFTFNPPDSTATMFEKGKALYLISEGKRMHSEGQYRTALIKFREALATDKGNVLATYWVGECHSSLGNYAKAIRHVKEAIQKDSEVGNNESGVVLGACYHRLEDLDKAISMYQDAKNKVKEFRAKELKLDFYIAQCERAKEMMKTPVSVKIKNLGMNINSVFDDYSAILAPDGEALYFVSRRADSKGGGVNPGDQRYFEDIYISFWDKEEKIWGEATNSHQSIRRINTEGFDAISYISKDGKYLYLTINTTAMEKPDPKTKSSDLFMCKRNNRGSWNSPKSLAKPINTILFDASASITADGNTMYYISERKGGEGKADIWTAVKIGKEWGRPTNLGPTINTKGQETTVFITPDEKYLFFSSTGHEGMGGYDIYVCKNNDGIWSDPVNMGYPINNVSDETHFSYYPKMKKAFYSTFSSSSNKGVGARDLFEVDMSKYKFKFPE